MGRIAALIAFLVLAVVGVSGCGGDDGPSESGSGDGGPPPAAAAANTVVIQNFEFGPADLTVAPGTVITVMNKDSAVHTMTADDDSFDTGNISQGQSAQITAPNAPGEYPYHCTPHQFMTGTLTVQ